MRVNTTNFTGDPLLPRTANGGATVSIPSESGATTGANRWWYRRACATI